MRKYNLMQKIWAIVLTLVMVIGMLPVCALAVPESNVWRAADASTEDVWKGLFVESDANGVKFTTENAGGIWTDKSVFTPDNVPGDWKTAGVNIAEQNDNFLVALSAVASNKEITGYSTIPTDTVFILDLSSSMQSNDDNGRSAIDELVDATNKAITDLLALNHNNRIGVVLYAGNTSKQFNDNEGITTILLPMDTYTTNQAGKYLESYNSDLSIRVFSGVRNAAGNGVAKNLDSARGTFTQDGVYEAMKMLLAQDTVVTEGVQAGTSRLPIMVLMTDGEPTMANNDYNGNNARTDLGTSNMYLRFNDQDYNHRYTIAFMTQLTAAFAKREVKQHYGDALMYTLAYGEEVTRLPEALAVMDPDQDTVLNDFWSDFLAGEDVTVFTTRSGQRPYRYSYLYATNDTAEPLVAADKLYADEYFPAESDQDLHDAFESIVEEIILQSKYYPTFVERDHDHDGYITFTDKIGGYMDVVDMKGILIGDDYFSGAAMAKTLNEGSLGTVQRPSALGSEFVLSVKERLGISDTAIARQLLQNAFDYGQLSYTSDTEYSNYIGWYSDAEGDYLDFWHEGITTAAPAGATHIIKSYGVLGNTDDVQGVSAEDMLYASIRISKEVEDYDGDGIHGETMVTWQIPASLIPTITYEVKVKVDADGNINGVEGVALESENVSPIRLLYEVALQEDIHDWNLAEKVNDGYKNSETNKDAGYVFYSNQWNKGDGGQELTNRNTYSHFEPSTQNERYYYTQDTVIYDASHNPVTSKPNASGTYYRQYLVYEAMNNGTFRVHEHYEQISAAALAEENLKQNDQGQWMVKKGVVLRYYNNYQFQKDANNHTNTMGYYFYPMIEVLQDNYYSTVTLGNNGKLTMTPATGIKVTKDVSEVVDGASNTFTFVISGGSGTATLVRLDAEGDEASRETLTFAAGKAEFTVQDGETVYIIGLVDGTEYTVSEKANANYMISSVAVNGQLVNGFDAVIEAEDQAIQSAEFTNSPKTFGGISITKELDPDLSSEYLALAAQKTFVMDVTTDAPDGNYAAVHSGDATIESITVADGKFTVALKPGDTITISQLPHEAKVTVAEQSVPGFIPTYLEDLATGDGVVTIVSDETASVVVRNDYEADDVTMNLVLSGEKTIEGRDWLDSDTFTFTLQKWNANAKAWESVAQDAATSADKTISFAKELTFTQAGAYTYQVVEEKGGITENGLTYDATKHNFTVTVTDSNMDGKLEIASVTSEHSDNAFVNQGNTWENSNINFVNRFEAADAQVVVNIQKKLTNDSGSDKVILSGYEFVLKDSLGNEVAKAHTDVAGEALLQFQVSDDGEYVYELVETEGGIPSMNYADPVKVFVKVTTNAELGVKEAVVTYPDGQLVEGGEVVITNVYDPKDATLTPVISKTLQGRNPADQEVYEFLFTRYTEDSQGNIQGKEVGKMTATYDADKAAWTYAKDAALTEELTFAKTGIYYYGVTEVNAGETIAGVTYDKAVYYMVVTVSDENGQLEAAYTLANTTGTSMGFVNTYKAADTELVIDGTKKLTGRGIINAEFKFNLTQVTDATGATVVENGLTMVAENGPHMDGDANTAKFAFDKIPYTSDDVGKEFFYRIEEVNSGSTILGVTHNTENVSYVVKVTVSDNGDGTLKAAPTIVKGGNEILFKNVYIPQGTTANIPGKKELTGRVLGAGEFSFTLVEKTDDTYATDKVNGVNQSVTNAADGSITFDALALDAVGDYYYVVEETAGTVGGITYDDTKYHVHIEVTDNGIGSLVATTHITMVIIPEEGDSIYLPTGGIDFHNVYEAAGTATISGSKELLGGKNLTDGAFSFELYEGTTKLDTAEVAANGTFSFDPIAYTVEDVDQTFTYTVKEVIPDDATDNGDGTWTKGQYIYDGSVFTVDVSVKDDAADGVLEITNAVTKNGAAAELKFTNTFVPAAIEHSLTAKKTYEKGLKGNDFEFTLMSADNKTNENQQKYNDDQGVVTFDPISFSAAGDYKFTITEKKEGILSFIRPSQAEYEVTVTVINTDGVLSVSNVAVVNTKGTNESDLEFINTYIFDGEGEVTLRGTKTLKGDRTAVKENEFEFGLYDEAGQLVESVKNDASGNFQFKTLKFDESHTDINGSEDYTYTVKEIPGNNARYDYDDTVYTVVITVKDNDQGGITVTHTVNGAANGAITFENTYTNPTPVTYTPEATKKYDKTLAGGEFTFKLEGEIAGVKVEQTKKNEAGGAVKFDTLRFPEADAYTFTVKEIEKVLGFIQYSVAEYKLTVNIVDTNGVLSLGDVVVEKVKGAADENDLTFVNKYVMDGEGEVTLRGTKTLKGDRTTVNAEEFVFGLYDAAGQLVESVKNDASGNFQFKTLKFDESHTEINGEKQYKYTVKEIAGTDPYVTYDASVYDVVVTVKDNNEGGVSVTYTVNGTANGVMAFENTFTNPDPVTITIDVTKIVENKTEPGITAKDFEILLYEGDVQRGVAKTGENGKAGFQITYGLEDVGKTVTYKVAEKKGKVAGVTYDETVHTVKVTVAAKEDGTLYTIINDKEASSVAVSFKNIYEKPATPVTGDDFPVFLVGGLLLISAAAFVVLLLTKKKGGKYAV